MNKQALDIVNTTTESEKEKLIRLYCKSISRIANGKKEDLQTLNAVKQLVHLILDADKSSNTSILEFDIFLYILFLIYYFLTYFSTLNKTVLDCFQQCLRSSCSSSFKGEILQALSLLLQNMKQDFTFLCFVSNNRLNPTLEMYYDFSDGELISYYVSVLRSLAFRMTSRNIFLFLTEV